MNIVLFSNQEHIGLYPLTYTKPLGELRMGIYTFKERWEKLLQTNSISYQTQEYLAEVFPLCVKEDNVFINPAYFPTGEWVQKIKSLQPNQAIFYQESCIAFRGSEIDFNAQNITEKISLEEELIHVNRPYVLFNQNHHALYFDYALATQGKESQPISETNRVLGKENIFIEEGAKVEFSILNASTGPIYIGKDAEVMEGSMLRGPIALCEHGVIKMGAKIYEETTIGPYCKVGGEIGNSILTGYSNKGHDGYLGNSVLGEWCNLGADTNTSNLKNNYAEVKLWNYEKDGFENTGLQFCGLIMGDHGKSAINTQFNTGTVAGPFANIFHAGFPPNKIEAFSWGGKRESPKFTYNKAMETAEKMMGRRKVELTQPLKELYKHLHDTL